jgi:hypothetical protein
MMVLAPEEACLRAPADPPRRYRHDWHEVEEVRTRLSTPKRRAANGTFRALTRQFTRAAVALGMVAACESEQLVKPTPPDTSELLDDLESPTGKLDGIAPADQAAFLDGALAQVEQVCGGGAMEQCDGEPACAGCALLERLSRTLREVAGSIGSGDRRQSEVSIPGVEGILFAHVTCPGWEANASRRSSGEIDATIGFTGRGLDPIVWGRFERCRQGQGKAAYELTGDFTITFQPEAPVPFDRIEQSSAVFGYEGTVRMRDASKPVRLRVALRGRLDGSGSRAIMFDTMSNGTFVAELRGDDVRVRGRDVTFRCDLREGRCDANTR